MAVMKNKWTYDTFGLISIENDKFQEKITQMKLDSNIRSFDQQVCMRKMGIYTFTAVFLVAHLMLLEETLGVDSASKSRLREVLDRRYQLARFPISDILLEGKEDSLGKRQEQFDDYGHMRFGKRGEESDDYGHMRFGKRD